MSSSNKLLAAFLTYFVYGVAASAALPSDVVVQYVGVPMGALLAAFAGGICSLSLLPTMPRIKMFGAVATGFFTAVYSAPFIARYLNYIDFIMGIAFFLGLFAHPIIQFGYMKVPDLLAGLYKRFGGNTQ